MLKRFFTRLRKEQNEDPEEVTPRHATESRREPSQLQSTRRRIVTSDITSEELPEPTPHDQSSRGSFDPRTEPSREREDQRQSSIATSRFHVPGSRFQVSGSTWNLEPGTNGKCTSAAARILW